MPINPTPIFSAEDKLILAAIREILAIKPTYGYRRITTLLNRRRYHAGLHHVNHKRIYRLMKKNHLLLPRYASKPVRVHNGKIITLHSNTRWCSDSFYIACDNGEHVQVAFSLDTCDREVMRFIASTRGIDGAMIRDLMTETMHYRFGQVDRLPKRVQWLTDNGPCYTAHDTVKFGHQIGLDVCTTRPYSPESNGMAEAFVKTFKRDYVWLGGLSSAAAVMKQLPQWFNDYNENAPHKGLKMLSPRQYICLRKIG
jgi:putative transposase